MRVLLHRQRAATVMADSGLDGLVATGPEHVLYTSDLTSWTLRTFRDRDVYAVVPRDGPLALIVSVDLADHLAERPATIDRLYTYGTYHIERNPRGTLSGAEARLLEIRETASHHANGLEALRQALSDCGLWGGRIGLDESGLSPARWQVLCDLLGPHQLVQARDLFRTIRRVKTPAEIDRLTYAARSIETGIAAAFDVADLGATEADLERTFRAAVAATGTDPGHFEVTAGPRSSASFPASATYQIQADDIVRADCGGWYQGYWADTGRTRAIGEPQVEVARYYAALRSGIDALLAAIRPGVTVSTLYEIGVGTVRDGGIPHYRRHHVGHAIGLEMYEAPLLAPTDNGAEALRLEEGMVLNIELPYYELGWGGLQIEETLVVHHDGPCLLTQASRDL